MLKGTNVYFLEWSPVYHLVSMTPSCLPILTGSSLMYNVGELMVDLHMEAKRANLRSGALQPSRDPIISTNTPPKHGPRLILLYSFKDAAAVF